jgi:hypothetical protein
MRRCGQNANEKGANMQLSKTYTPGYWNVTLSSATLGALDAIAAVMIPGRSPYPPASEVGVAAFVASRCDPEEAALLADLADEFVAQGGDAQALTELEATRPTDFPLLRFYVYSGYYCAPAVLAVVSARSDYHASPQPWGYVIDEPLPSPTSQRGAFTPTEEVRNVFDA